MTITALSPIIYSYILPELPVLRYTLGYLTCWNCQGINEDFLR